jgi:hypothetical protein
LSHSRQEESEYPEFSGRQGEFVRVAGEPSAFAAETDKVPSNIDHFWITIRTGSPGLLRIALSTHSRSNAAAGFDPRMRLGVVGSEWLQLPEAGVFSCHRLDYADIEAATPMTYVEHERPALEELLVKRSERAIFIEAWGELYLRTHLGIHQVHSRRTSCSVRENYTGRDGAIRFYFPAGISEMLLFKYCGQA